MFLLEKSIEAATFLLAKLGGEMPYIKLIKLMYLADREQVRRRGRTITGDTHWSLPYGPVLEHTLDAIKGADERWASYVQVDTDAKLIWLIKQAEPAKMSRADVEVLERVAAQFGHLPWQELVDFTHKLPEWQEPKGSRTRIYLKSIAEAVGHSPEQVREILAADRERREVGLFVDSLTRSPDPIHA